MLKIKVIHTASMCKNTTNNSVEQQKTLFSLPEPVLSKKRTPKKAKNSKIEHLF